MKKVAMVNYYNNIETSLIKESGKYWKVLKDEQCRNTPVPDCRRITWKYTIFFYKETDKS